MPKKLIIVLIISILIFLFYVLKNVKQNKLNIKNSLIWIILSIGIIICTLQINNLEKLAKLAGIKTVSNMLFFLGFIFLIFTCFNITKTISMQNRKIVTLTQELALLRKEMEDENEKSRRNKKNS